VQDAAQWAAIDAHTASIAGKRILHHKGSKNERSEQADRATCIEIDDEAALAKPRRPRRDQRVQLLNDGECGAPKLTSCWCSPHPGKLIAQRL
jgi:hypothetical protein